MSRNAPGEGSVYKRNSDGRFVATIPVAGGAPILFYGTTRKEAVGKRAEAIREGRNRRLDGAASTTVGEYLAWWLEAVKQPTIMPQTYRNYRIQMGHVVPRIGSIRLRDLRPHHVLTALADMEAAGASATLRGHVIRRLRDAFRAAVDLDYLPETPMKRVTPPKTERREMQTLPDDDVLTLLAATENTRWHAMWRLLLSYGFRISELRALTWAEIDEERGLIHIRHSVSDPKGGCVVGPVKSRSGRRTVPLVSETLDTLRGHRVLIARERLAAVAWPHPELVFPSVHGTYLRVSVIEDNWNRTLDALGMGRIRIHDTRHTAITRMLRQTGDYGAAQQIAGHASARITIDTYGHVTEGHKRSVLERSLAALRRA